MAALVPPVLSVPPPPATWVAELLPFRLASLTTWSLTMTTALFCPLSPLRAPFLWTGPTCLPFNPRFLALPPAPTACCCWELVESMLALLPAARNLRRIGSIGELAIKDHDYLPIAIQWGFNNHAFISFLKNHCQLVIRTCHIAFILFSRTYPIANAYGGQIVWDRVTPRQKYANASLQPFNRVFVVLKKF